MNYNKLNKIGLVPSKEFEELKSKLHVSFYKSPFFELFENEIMTTMYINDHDLRARQFRYETWERIDRYTIRILNMKFVRDDVFEGEQISVAWD